MSDQSCSVRDALGKDVAVFGKMSTQGVDALRTLMHQKVLGSEHHAVGLLLLVFVSVISLSDASLIDLYAESVVMRSMPSRDRRTGV